MNWYTLAAFYIHNEHYHQQHQRRSLDHIPTKDRQGTYPRQSRNLYRFHRKHRRQYVGI